MRSPNLTNGYNLLNGVAVVASNNVWAVGQAANGSTYSTLIEHWNGSAWSIVPSPNTAGLSNVLTAVTVVSANDIWAVGYSTDNNTFNNFALTLHWNGSAWSIVPSPILDHDILFAVDAIASNDVWAVGRSRPGGYSDDKTLTMHWDGSNWSIFPSPNGIGDNIFFGVAGISSNDVWAVGQAGSLSTSRATLGWVGLEYRRHAGFQLERNEFGPGRDRRTFQQQYLDGRSVYRAASRQRAVYLDRKL